jgi:hypothetical protein
MKIALAGLTALVTAVAAGCAAEPVPAEAHGSTVSHEEVGGGGVPDNVVSLTVDQQSVIYTDGAHVIVCKDAVEPSLAAKLDGLVGGAGSPPVVVLDSGNGKVESRTAEFPTLEPGYYACSGSGDAFMFQLWETNVGWLNQDISGAFMDGISGDNFECDETFTLSHGLDVQVSNFKVVNGVLQKPDITVKLEGDSSAGASAHCSITFHSKPLVAFAGPVPILYEIELGIGVKLGMSEPTHLSAIFGTSQNDVTLSSDSDPTITIEPSVELGVTFYGVVGGYVDVGFPIDIETHAGCSPDVSMGVEMTYGVQAGLLGFHDLPINAALQASFSTSVVPETKIHDSQCP